MDLDLQRIRDLTRSQRHAEALALLARLESIRPQFSLLHQERGACLLAVDDRAGAIAAFRRATALNPALLASWVVLERLYREAGDRQNCAIASGQVSLLQRLPPAIVHAGSAFSDGDLDSARRLLEDHVRQSGAHVEALRLLARIALKRGAASEAERILREVLAVNPDYRAARQDFAHALFLGQQYAAAQCEVSGLLALEPGNTAYLTLMAAIHAAGNEHAQAIALYRRLTRENPSAAEARVCLGHSLQACGHQSAAIQAYREAAAIAPTFGDAYWSLANLKVYRFSDDELRRMQVAERGSEVPQVDRYHFHFALGKAYQDRGDHAQSWRYYESGNALKRLEVDYSADAVEADAASVMATHTRDSFRTREAVGHPGVAPIFIVGMPRSGSTLLEQILASHSRVESGGELPVMSRIARGLKGSTIAALMPGEYARLGLRYVEETQAHRSDGLRLIDKMPNNFWHIGLIHRLLPNAKIIDVRRHPMDCCFGNYTQLFASGQEFTYDLTDVARYYRTYLALMRHWERVLPGRVLRVHYEDLVANLEGGIRRVLAYCDLDYEPQCLEFHRSVRAVNTASSEQVRRPLTSEGIGRWRHYEPWLAGLEEALGDATLRYREL